MLDNQIELLKEKVLSLPPSVEWIAEAMSISASEPNEVPAWVDILAGGNPDLYIDVIDEAKRWMDAEQNDKPELRPGNQRG